MNRRGFLGTLFGLSVAPTVVARVITAPPKPKYKLQTELSKCIQEEIDREVLEMLTRNT
jgi:hypothetical protein